MCRAFEVLSLVLKGVYNCKQLLVIGFVVLFSVVELPRLEGDRMLLAILLASVL
jgi:hypothetical protein